MAIGIKLVLTGSEATYRRLEQLGVRIEQDILPQAMFESSNIIAEGLKEHAPVDKAHLRRAVGIRRLPTPQHLYHYSVGIRPMYKWFGKSTGWRKAKLHDPELYGTLQDKGFYHVLAKREITNHKGWFRRGYYSRRERALAKMRQVIRDGIAAKIR